MYATFWQSELLEVWRYFGYRSGMDREQVIATLRAHEADLRHRGVLHAALFGSVARNEAEPGSDIDILIELEPHAPIDLIEYVGITHCLADLFPVRVDVANARFAQKWTNGQTREGFRDNSIIF